MPLSHSVTNAKYRMVLISRLDLSHLSRIKTMITLVLLSKSVHLSFILTTRNPKNILRTRQRIPKSITAVKFSTILLQLSHLEHNLVWKHKKRSRFSTRMNLGFKISFTAGVQFVLYALMECSIV